MEKFQEALERYEKKFNDSFPTFSLLSHGEEKVIKMIDDCISQGKDAYEMGYLELDDDIKY